MSTDAALASPPFQARLRSHRLFDPVDIASLACFRIAFGAIMLWEVIRYFQNGWIASYFIAPKFHFHYFGLEWINPWPGQGMYVHFAALGVLAVGVMIGCFYRVCATLMAIGFTYVFLLERANYLNHFYLICLICFIMACLPAHRAMSVDAWRKRRIRSQTTPTWTLWLLRFQIALPYFFGGIAKLNADWLAGEPLQTWLFDDRQSAFGPFSAHAAALGLSWGGMLFDLLIVPMLLWRRSRPLALVLALAFNVTNAHLFQIGIFPWFMIAGTLMFLSPSWPRVVWRRVLRHSAMVTPSHELSHGAAHSAELPARHRLGRQAITAALALYVFIQLALPLRHFLYPGPVSWTEEGHLYSWHMKLRDKSGEVNFIAWSPVSGKTWVVDHRQYLTPRQVRKMPARPDMIHEFARFLGRELESQGHSPVRIGVQSLVSLNGRPPQPLIDPRVDLSREPVTLGAKRWILPLDPAAFEQVRTAEAE